MALVRRTHRASPSADFRLMTHLRATVWDPAEFVGPPPRWLVAEGFLARFLTTGAVVGTTLYGTRTGRPSLADGERGPGLRGGARAVPRVRRSRACAGRCRRVARRVPRAARPAGGRRSRADGTGTGAVRDRDVGRGRLGHGRRTGRYLCSVRDADGMPLKVRIWRGCAGTNDPPRGRDRARLRPRGAGGPARCGAGVERMGAPARSGAVGGRSCRRKPGRGRPLLPAFPSRRREALRCPGRTRAVCRRSLGRRGGRRGG